MVLNMSETKWFHAIENNSFQHYIFFLCLEMEFLFFGKEKPTPSMLCVAKFNAAETMC